MADIIKITLTFILILLLLRKKWNVGYVLMVASGVLATLYLMHPAVAIKTIYFALTSSVTLELLIALTFIRMFEMILRDRKVLQQMMESMKGMLRNKRGLIVSMPLLIGMLPSVGGAYFSAPMVDEATKELNLTPEDKAFTNYWYRHPWEFILPLYPGIVLASVITKVELREFIFLNVSYAVTMFLSGMLFGMKGVKGAFPVKNNLSRKGLWNFLPILLLLMLVIIFRIKLHYALVFIVVTFLMFYRYNYHSTVKVLKYGFSMDIVVLILGIMLFKESLETSGAVENLSHFFTEKGIPVLPILFVLPFISGILTGFTVGFVGSTFPLILSLTGTDPYSLSFAFASGYIGVLLSPVHVCLILTREYFKADMLRIYNKTIPAAFMIVLVSIIEYFFFVL